MAIVSAAPHLALLLLRCADGERGFLVLGIKDKADEARLRKLSGGDRPPAVTMPETVEAEVLARLARTSRGAWGLDIIKLEQMRVIANHGSGYRTLEWLDSPTSQPWSRVR